MNKYLKTAGTLFAAILVQGTLAVAQAPVKISFDGLLSEQRLPVGSGSALPSDWSDYSHLVLEMRTSTPQRFSMWVYRNDGTPVRIMLQPFGQNVWLRASIPLQYLKGMDKSGHDLASSINRRTNSFWMSVWGPFGELKSVNAIGFAMTYPINKPTVEIRSMRLSKRDEGSDFLEKLPVLTEFNQWAHAEWATKVKNKEQLASELAAEEKAFGTNADFGYCDLGGYKSTSAKATGFFRVEQIEGKWWFIDPHGHYYLSTGLNGVGGRRPGSTTEPTAAATRMTKRMASWGMTTGGDGRVNTVMLRWPSNNATSFLGLPDVYAPEYAQRIDSAAKAQCTLYKEDKLVLGYFVGNEPPWDARESEVVDMILAGPSTATQTQLKQFLAGGDSPLRRKQFVIKAFEKFLELTGTAIKKYDPNHLNIGIRFGGPPSDEVLSTGRVFDVCSINVYEYEPTKLIDKVHRLTGRPVLIGEFHLGVPADGLGAGLVQAQNQVERGVGYRYYVEQGAALSAFLGAHWFTWKDEPVLGRGDGENYNIGFVDATDRPYRELIDAAKATNKRLYEVHAGKILPFNQRPKASEAGTPASPWGY